MSMDAAAYAANIAQALESVDESVRVKAAMAAGTHPHPSLLEPLVRRCGVEPDFFVRETLSWALTRLNPDDVLPRLHTELSSANLLARTQAVHTLSKVADERAWPWITPELLHHADDDLARTSWRAAATLAPVAQRPQLATELSDELGRGGESAQDIRMALTMALLSLGDAAIHPVRAKFRADDPDVAEHARATELLRIRPELIFASAVEEAKRIAALGLPDPAQNPAD